MAPRQRFNPVDFYRKAALRKPLAVRTPRTRHRPATTPQLSTVGHLFDKFGPVIADYITSRREKGTRSADEANVMKMITALTAPRTAYDPDKYGTSPEELMAAAEGYTPEDGVDEQILSPEAQRKFYTEEANRVKKAYETGEPAGADLVRQQAAAGAYNMPDETVMGPRSSDLMMKILLGDKTKKDAAAAAELKRSREMEDYIKKEQYKYRSPKTIKTAEGVYILNPDGSLGTRLGGAKAETQITTAKYGNKPIWGKNEKGESVIMQPSSAGGLRVAELPPGVTAQRGGTSRVDLGDRWAILDANGDLIGYRAKGIDPEKTPQHVGSVSAAKAGGTGIANKRLKDYSLARNATNNIKDIDMLTSRLLSTDENVVGFLVDLRVFRDQALAKGFGSQEALARVTDTQMVNTLTGKEVFPLIKALGIGARGLDTPAERKFLREVLTGDKTLTKDTLLEMAAMRRRVQVRNIERWNKDYKDGSLDDFLKTNNIPSRPFAMPPPAPVHTPIDSSGPISQMSLMQLNKKFRNATAEERRLIDLRLKELGY